MTNTDCIKLACQTLAEFLDRKMAENQNTRRWLAVAINSATTCGTSLINGNSHRRQGDDGPPGMLSQNPSEFGTDKTHPR